MEARVLLLCAVLFLLVHTPPAAGGLNNKCAYFRGQCRRKCPQRDIFFGFCRNHDQCCLSSLHTRH
uniref:Defensin-B2 n=1 Tax=Ornithorhynchus anatinus TaxID=9258 RepID=DEFB2_ORNAN|nr:RecName: Full=Defensin-B2; Short=DefB2; Short=OaDefB2; Flags: Precursor [Ornithorhynchus anatinus]